MGTVLSNQKEKFLSKHGIMDSPDIFEETSQLYLSDHFYYIDEDQGYFIKRDIALLTDEEKVILEYLKENQET